MQVLQHYRRTITFLFPNGAAGAALIQSKGLPFTGKSCPSARSMARTQAPEPQNSKSLTAWVSPFSTGRPRLMLPATTTNSASPLTGFWMGRTRCAAPSLMTPGLPGTRWMQ